MAARAPLAPPARTEPGPRIIASGTMVPVADAPSSPEAQKPEEARSQAMARRISQSLSRRVRPGEAPPPDELPAVPVAPAGDRTIYLRN